ncbi:MAG: hypothetical protein HGB36_00605 [Chlorobiaceae bacterium]|nr:hypothetical protein [Chlorobiaceae bacterium]
MSITDNGSEPIVSATEIHVAGRIGIAVAKTLKGYFMMRYGDGEQTVTIRWMS